MFSQIAKKAKCLQWSTRSDCQIVWDSCWRLHPCHTLMLPITPITPLFLTMPLITLVALPWGCIQEGHVTTLPTLRIEFHLCSGTLKSKWNTHSIAKAGDLPKIHELTPSSKEKNIFTKIDTKWLWPLLYMFHMSWQFFHLNQKVPYWSVERTTNQPMFCIIQTICLSHSSLK